ncbi:MAG: DUF2461 domain-containing protein [Caulobacterales bacterium]|nr:DUF2461 domain-containing protein [Caulobacterales bacterium]
MAFAGFPPDMFAFFRELKANNEKAWFEANRARYEEQVKGPLIAFVAAMAPKIAQISAHIVADPKKSPFRIHRDVRFSKDKSPYKTHAGVQFRHAAGKDAHAPGFYVHLQPGQVFYGGGLWKPSSEPLSAIRAAIDSKPDAWRKATASAKVRTLFGGLSEGDPLTRAPKGYRPDHPMIDDIKKRSFFLMADADEETAVSASFTDDVAKAFAVAAPAMGFLCQAVGAEF